MTCGAGGQGDVLGSTDREDTGGRRLRVEGGNRIVELGLSTDGGLPPQAAAAGRGGLPTIIIAARTTMMISSRDKVPRVLSETNGFIVFPLFSSVFQAKRPHHQPL